MADRSTASVLLRSYFNKKESKESNSKSDPDMTCRLCKKEVSASKGKYVRIMLHVRKLL